MLIHYCDWPREFWGDEWAVYDSDLNDWLSICYERTSREIIRASSFLSTQVAVHFDFLNSSEDVQVYERLIEGLRSCVSNGFPVHGYELCFRGWRYVMNEEEGTAIVKRHDELMSRGYEMPPRYRFDATDDQKPVNIKTAAADLALS